MATDKHNRHAVVLTFNDGVYAKLICPPSGCAPATTCPGCGRHVEGPSPEGCYDCRDGYGDECWVKGWFDNCTAEELLQGEITVEIDASFDGDTMLARIVGSQNVAT